MTVLLEMKVDKTANGVTRTYVGPGANGTANTIANLYGGDTLEIKPQAGWGGHGIKKIERYDTKAVYDSGGAPSATWPNASNTLGADLTVTATPDASGDGSYEGVVLHGSPEVTPTDDLWYLITMHDGTTIDPEVKVRSGSGSGSWTAT